MTRAHTQGNALGLGPLVPRGQTNRGARAPACPEPSHLCHPQCSPILGSRPGTVKPSDSRQLVVFVRPPQGGPWVVDMPRLTAVRAAAAAQFPPGQCGSGVGGRGDAGRASAGSAASRRALQRLRPVSAWEVNPVARSVWPSHSTRHATLQGGPPAEGL